jgi:hypothetical protein
MDSSLINESDIDYFNWDKQILCLKGNAAQRLRKLDIPLRGLAVALTLDKEPVYGFWLWNRISSFSCDWIVSVVYPNTNNLMLGFGLPKGNSKGTDPRQNEKLKKYLIEKKIIK